MTERRGHVRTRRVDAAAISVGQQSNNRHLTMTFVISAFQIYVLHFGHFFENRKNSGLTPGQNDDPVTHWAIDPVTQ